MRAFAQALSLGMGKDVVVVLGDKDVTKSRYYRQRPHMEFLRVLAEVTNLIMVGEYFTSKKAHCCVQRKPDGGHAWNDAGPGDIVRHLCYLRSCIDCIAGALVHCCAPPCSMPIGVLWECVAHSNHAALTAWCPSLSLAQTVSDEVQAP